MEGIALRADPGEAVLRAGPQRQLLGFGQRVATIAALARRTTDGFSTSVIGLSSLVIPHFIAEMDTYDLWMAFFRESQNNLLSALSDVPRG